MGELTPIDKVCRKYPVLTAEGYKPLPDPACLKEHCAKPVPVLIGDVYVEHCRVPDTVSTASPATPVATAPADTAPEDSTLPKHGGMRARLMAEGRFAFPGLTFLPEPVEDMLPPEYGGALGVELSFANGTRASATYGAFVTRLERIPEDLSLRHEVSVAMPGKAPFFRVNKHIDAALEDNPGFSINVIDFKNRDTIVSFAAKTFAGVSVNMWDRVEIGAGFSSRFPLFGEELKHPDLTFGAVARFNLGKKAPTPTTAETSPAGRTVLRLARLGVGVIGAWNFADAIEHVGGIPRFRSLGLPHLLAIVGALDFGRVSYNIKALTEDSSKLVAAVMAGGTMLTGVAMGAAGGAVGEPALAGIGASAFCGGISGIATAAGAKSPWFARGLGLGCAVGVGAAGAILLATNKDLTTEVGAPVMPTDTFDPLPEKRYAVGMTLVSAAAGALLGTVVDMVRVSLAKKATK